jgi:BlaI family penicillinase repressor
MTPQETLGKVELELLQQVSRLQPVSVRVLVEELADSSGQARTTVQTTLERLRRKGFLRRRKLGGVNHYSAKVPVTDLLPRLVGDFVKKMLGGSVSPFVSYMQEQDQIDAEELAQLKSLVAELEARQAKTRNSRELPK